MFQWKQLKSAGESTRSYSLDSFPLRPRLPLPAGISRQALFDWVRTVRVADAPDSISQYCDQDFERFVHTLGLVQHASASSNGSKIGLELGANPYFTTMLLRQFTSIEWRLANYFGTQLPTGDAIQRVFVDPFGSREPRTHIDFSYSHFNIEEDTYPFETCSFDIVLFCEIIEHLLNDPCKVLREIRRVLNDGGTLVLTTPNVNRLENVARMIAGANIYDPYSGYGPYGRHNREYNKHELYHLLNYLGFTVEEIFTADVNPNLSANYLDLTKFGPLIDYRKHDLGQYIFVRARKSGVDQGKKPAWLYRSYEPAQLDD
ncbi:MAG: class I SAM-dependent methyltransferase [Pseudomonadota bacterium]|nr:class I SAM-dependent methyltransferase [Pseudomonadota bacterium]